MLAVYSAGLAIPFILTALAFSRMTTTFAVVKRHYQAIVAVGGVILIVFGATQIIKNWMMTIMCVIAGTVLIRAEDLVVTLGALVR